jgi:D-inositol-3-phosphate glycosyltransferase
MATCFQPTNTPAVGVPAHEAAPSSMIEVALLTAGRDRHYALDLTVALAAEGISLDVVGSDEIDSPELHTSDRIHFVNLRTSQRQNTGFASKAWGVLTYYSRLIRYAKDAKPKIFHILWNGKFEYFDRTLLMLYYKLLGKRIVFTAHNVNAGRRDSNDTWLNRVTLTCQYRLVDHIFVHTEKMKNELVEEFGVGEQAITVIPYGINNSVPVTDLSTSQAKETLGIKAGEKTILFFGNIGPYKGLDVLVAAFQRLVSGDAGYRLVIAGKLRRGAQGYWEQVRGTIARNVDDGRVIQKIEHIPDDKLELYFKAADVLALPYSHIYQSGVLFLGYSFGLPVVAADVGSLAEDVVEGRTGFLCKPGDPEDLAHALERYFQSSVYRELPRRRPEIKEYGCARHSWDIVGRSTHVVYRGL